MLPIEIQKQEIEYVPETHRVLFTLADRSPECHTCEKVMKVIVRYEFMYELYLAGKKRF